MDVLGHPVRRRCQTTRCQETATQLEGQGPFDRLKNFSIIPYHPNRSANVSLLVYVGRSCRAGKPVSGRYVLEHPRGPSASSPRPPRCVSIHPCSLFRRTSPTTCSQAACHRKIPCLPACLSWLKGQVYIHIVDATSDLTRTRHGRRSHVQASSSPLTRMKVAFRFWGNREARGGAFCATSRTV